MTNTYKVGISIHVISTFVAEVLPTSGAEP